MKIGVVGKANVGKSTFFKALTLADILIANYPFATIKPNTGVGFVKIDCADKDFNTQCHPRMGYCMNHKRFVPVEVIDVAGLVPGAYEGKGMGNQFLDDLRQADVLIHVIDAAGATNEKGEPVEPGSRDPAEDIRFLEIELDMWYLNIIKRGWDRFAKAIQQSHSEIHKALAKQLSGLSVTDEMMIQVIQKLNLNPENVLAWTDDDLKKMAIELRMRTKPMVIAANKIDIPITEKNIERLRKEFPQHMILPCSAESELALKEAAKKEMITYLPGDKTFSIKKPEALSERQTKALQFLQANILDKWGSTGVQDILDTAVLQKLGYIAIYPGGVSKLADSDGNVLPDCFLLPPDSTAIDFAYRLHSDFGKRFIRALDVKTRMAIGRDHKLKHRDVVEIVADA